MTDVLWFGWSIIWSLVLCYLPGFLCLRALGIWRGAACAVAPAVSAGLLGGGAVVAALIGVRWTLSSAALVTILAVAVVAGARRLLAARRARPRTHPGTPSWLPLVPPRARVLVPLAATVAVVPVLIALGSPGTPLQRWDALFHLSALQHVRESGDGSTLTFAALATTDGTGGIYPAAFHDLIGIVPLAPIPIVLNAATLALAVVPWIHGTMFLARALWPRASWAPTVAGTAAALAPAIPLNEWIHLSPIPNLVGAAFLPGALVAVLCCYRALRACLTGSSDTALGPWAISALIASAGLGLLHPNVFIALCLMTAAAGFGGAVEQRRRARPSRAAAVIGAAALLPVAAIIMTPASSTASGFVGGLEVGPVQAVGEVVSGLLTVWPMATGPLLWAVAYVGLWALLRRGSYLLPAVTAVMVVLYLDAAVDSPLRLSALWYSGQDRISMFLTLVVCLLTVPGTAHLARWLRRSGKRSALIWRSSAAVLGVLVVLSSVAPRLDYARLNLDLDMVQRPRYMDSEELAMLEQVGTTMDTDKVLLANPFSGGAHLSAMTGQRVRFPVAGMNPTPEDGQLMDDLLRAGTDPEACTRLMDAGIGYVYVDRRPYYYGGSFTRIDQATPELGRVIGQTDHSMMIEISCAAA
ncbi:DUF6541 family protein [Brachybacterium hainanense]|uniref:DUF6541 family protein n=1 Tax=Brachybacterium hainanense TaxID=1541174 RepID=A0ABV6RDF0_9MICO